MKASTDRDALAQLLGEGIEAMGLSIADDIRARLLQFLILLNRWNVAYNLTAVRDSREMISRHLLDSLSILPWIQGPRLLDVGSGGGMPGIPLAMVRPDTQWVLLDSNGKKTRFLTQCCLELGLANVSVHHGRLEQYQPSKPFPQITSRAFASLSDLVGWSRHLLAEGGEYLAMKGQYPTDEIAALPSNFEVRESHRLDVPGCEGERHLLIIAAHQPTG